MKKQLEINREVLDASLPLMSKAYENRANHVLYHLTSHKEDVVVKKKLSVGLVLAIVLMLITVTVLAAVLLSGKDFVQEVLRPKAQENQSLSWTGEDVAVILRIAGENGLSLSDEQQARLLEGGGYYKEELMRLFVKLDLGEYPSTWSIEDQVWYSRIMADLVPGTEVYATLPEEGEATEVEVLAVLQAHIQQQYDPDAPLTDETIYRRHTTYTWDAAFHEKSWVIGYEPLDLIHTAYYFELDAEANILGESAIPGIARSEESPTPVALQSRYEELYGKFHEWEMDTWVSFREMLREAAAVHGFGGSEALELLALSEFALPKDGDISKNEAVDAAMTTVMAQEGVQESDLRRGGAYVVYLLGEEAAVWKATIPAIKEGDYIAEVSAQTGEVRNIHFVPLDDSGRVARSFVLESVYQEHHKEIELQQGTLRFDGRRASVKTLRNGDYLLFGRVWVDADTTDAWAARVSPSGEILWETRNGEGIRFSTAVTLSDGGFLLAMTPKRSDNSFPLMVVSLDADGQMQNDPITLEAEGWAYEGKDCLLVSKYYEGSGTRPMTWLAVNGKGETLWEHTYNELKGAGGWLWPAASGYIYSGMENGPILDPSSNSGWRNSWGMMARLDDQGNFLWKRLLEQYSFAGLSCSLEASDGGMFGAGTDIEEAWDDDGECFTKPDFVARFDAEGNVLWCHSYPQLLLTDPWHPNLDIAVLLPTPDDGVLVIAQNWDLGKIKLLHLDKSGTVLADWWLEIDFPINYVEAFSVGGQSYLIYHDKPEFAPAINTYITPIEWPEN